MSRYGKDSWGEDKNDLFDEMRLFLDRGHPISELLDIVADIVRDEECVYECNRRNNE